MVLWLFLMDEALVYVVVLVPCCAVVAVDFLVVPGRWSCFYCLLLCPSDGRVLVVICKRCCSLQAKLAILSLLLVGGVVVCAPFSVSFAPLRCCRRRRCYCRCNGPLASHLQYSKHFFLPEQVFRLLPRFVRHKLKRSPHLKLIFSYLK